MRARLPDILGRRYFLGRSHWHRSRDLPLNQLLQSLSRLLCRLNVTRFRYNFDTSLIDKLGCIYTERTFSLTFCANQYQPILKRPLTVLRPLVYIDEPIV